MNISRIAVSTNFKGDRIPKYPPAPVNASISEVIEESILTKVPSLLAAVMISNNTDYRFETGKNGSYIGKVERHAEIDEVTGKKTGKIIPYTYERREKDGTICIGNETQQAKYLPSGKVIMFVDINSPSYYAEYDPTLKSTSINFAQDKVIYDSEGRRQHYVNGELFSERQMVNLIG